MQTVEKFSPDWAAIKRGWIAGSPSIRALAKANGISDTAIRKQAAKEGWPVRGSGEASDCEPAREPEQTAKAETDLGRSITASADADPKTLAKSGRQIVEMLMAELRICSSSIDVLERIIEEETRGERSPKRRQLLLRLVSLPTRTQAARNLASAISILVDAGPGKKEQADDAARDVAGGGGAWGDDLNPFAGQPKARPN